MELNDSQKKADQMNQILESSRSHYAMLENKYEHANQLLRTYQERYYFYLHINLTVI